MLGLMFTEMESFSESKQEPGYGVDLQKLHMEVRFGFREFVEETMREKIEEKKKKMNIGIMMEAIEGYCRS
ncbi:hypothetical protein F3Y22_tig00112498pilonHSYRG00031 [Hibiscus syriacus]|uniref:Uncharacterized protein n=1 Tax=Hibiscus syriacus TaxID=106335 RepID=A0A6A2WX05_HIBSY|nr:hypothetical protein F3Y22_tig00112498pilonHSYRG00031 [Hibiscus syriacus]